MQRVVRPYFKAAPLSLYLRQNKSGVFIYREEYSEFVSHDVLLGSSTGPITLTSKLLYNPPKISANWSSEQCLNSSGGTLKTVRNFNLQKNGVNLVSTSPKNFSNDVCISERSTRMTPQISLDAQINIFLLVGHLDVIFLITLVRDESADFLTTLSKNSSGFPIALPTWVLEIALPTA